MLELGDIKMFEYILIEHHCLYIYIYIIFFLALSLEVLTFACARLQFCFTTTM